MSSFGGSPLWQSLQDLAFARGGLDQRSDQKFVRGRVAMLVWLPGFFLILFAAVSLQNPAVLIGWPLLAVVLWLFAKRPGWISRLRGRKDPKRS